MASLVVLLSLYRYSSLLSLTRHSCPYATRFVPSFVSYLPHESRPVHPVSLSVPHHSPTILATSLSSYTRLRRVALVTPLLTPASGGYMVRKEEWQEWRVWWFSYLSIVTRLSYHLLATLVPTLHASFHRSSLTFLTSLALSIPSLSRSLTTRLTHVHRVAKDRRDRREWRDEVNAVRARFPANRVRRKGRVENGETGRQEEWNDE